MSTAAAPAPAAAAVIVWTESDECDTAADALMTGDEAGGEGGGGGWRVREANRFSTSIGVFCCKRRQLRTDGSLLTVSNVERWADDT